MQSTGYRRRVSDRQDPGADLDRIPANDTANGTPGRTADGTAKIPANGVTLDMERGDLPAR